MLSSIRLDETDSWLDSCMSFKTIKTDFMIFGFPHTERVLFRSNFLRTVTFQYAYDAVVISLYKELIKTALRDLFPRINEGRNVSYEIKAANGQTPIIKTTTESEGFILVSNDGLTRVNFTNNNVIVTVLGNAYKRYEEVKPILEKVTRVLEQAGISQLKRVSVRKLNIIAFSSQDNSLSGIFSDLFADGIINAIEAFPQPEALKQNMHSIVLNKDNYRLNLNYGVPEYDNRQRPITGSIVIDIDLLKFGDTPVADLMDITTEINDEIYGIFSWMTSTKMKKEIMGYEK